jgi:Domain of unknown function (DUF5753)
MSSSEKVTFERFDYSVLTTPEVRGVDEYNPHILPLHLRTIDYDKQLVTGATLLDDETPFSPDSGEDALQYEKRLERREGIRQRIEAGALRARTLMTRTVLRNVLGSSNHPPLPRQDEIDRQATALESLQADAETGYEVGIVNDTSDLRPVSTGGFMIISHTDDTKELVDHNRRGGFVIARGKADENVVRSQKSFDNLWNEATTHPKELQKLMAQEALRLRNILL